MHWAMVHRRLVAMMGRFGPSLRVIALAYTGLGGMLALTLVVSLALVPVAPALQQVAEPARQAVNDLVQPTADAVTIFFGGGPVVRADPILPGVQPDRAPASFSEPIDPDVPIADELEATPLAEPPIVVATTAVWAPAARSESPAGEADDEIVGIEP